MSRSIYLDHPSHGSHVVYNVAEAEEMGKKGWLLRPSKATPEKVLRTLAAQGDAKAAALLPAAEVVELPKRGKK
jgi:hypothetical protein